MDWLSTLNSFVWGWPTIILLVGLGVYLMVGLRFMPILALGAGFRELIKGRKAVGEGEIPPFRALMTAMSATVGTGNIAGVATAIALGGPGAIFWMWIMGLFGMATKYSEAVLAVEYREQTPRGEFHGGPMYYIKRGLGSNWTWLAWLFALFASVAAFGIGNMVQSNSVADGLNAQFGISEQTTGIVIAVLAGMVILGGLKNIAAVASRLVPLMAIAYVSCALIVILMHITEVPGAFALIIQSAFTGHAAVGGFAGSAVMMAIQFGIARGIFSNEAGLGSAAIAHASAQNASPVRQGQVAMLGTFIDTLIICTMTALVIVISGEWTTGASGATLTTQAFTFALADAGGIIVSVAAAIFAFTTVLGWSFYGERCIQFLAGRRVLLPFRITSVVDETANPEISGNVDMVLVLYRLLWIVALYIGSTVELNTLWLLADTLNGLMAWPNLIGMLLLSTVVFRLTREQQQK